MYLCPKCNSEVNLSEIEIYESRNILIVEILTKEKTTSLWRCPKCKSENPQNETQLIKETRKQPFYLKVVPTCPIRQIGLTNRLGFHEKFSTWFYNYLEELESQLGLYRIEYAAQIDEDDEPDFKDSGD